MLSPWAEVLIKPRINPRAALPAWGEPSLRSLPSLWSCSPPVFQQPFPKKFPFSEFVPKVYSQIKEFIYACLKFSEDLHLRWAACPERAQLREQLDPLPLDGACPGWKGLWSSGILAGHVCSRGGRSQDGLGWEELWGSSPNPSQGHLPQCSKPGLGHLQGIPDSQDNPSWGCPLRDVSVLFLEGRTERGCLERGGGGRCHQGLLGHLGSPQASPRCSPGNGNSVVPWKCCQEASEGWIFGQERVSAAGFVLLLFLFLR